MLSEWNLGITAAYPLRWFQQEAVLPRYYFHLYNDEVLKDQTGEEFVDEGAAYNAALRGISELIAETIVQGKRVYLGERIEVVNENGKIVTSVRVGDLFQQDAPVTIV